MKITLQHHFRSTTQQKPSSIYLKQNRSHIAVAQLQSDLAAESDVYCTNTDIMILPTQTYLFVSTLFKNDFKATQAHLQINVADCVNLPKNQPLSIGNRLVFHRKNFELYSFLS